MKTITAIFVIALVGLAIACKSVPIVSEATPTPRANFDALDEWYSSDILADNIRQAYRQIGQQPPSVGHFAQACVLLRKAGFAESISREELASRTRGDAYYTSYNAGIAWLLAGGTPTEQKEWCDKVVALYNFEPWFGDKIEW